MRHRRTDDPHMELVGKVDVGGEAARTDDERPILEPLHGGADRAHHRIFSATARTAARMFW